MRKKNSTVLLNCQTHLINNYLAKILSIIEKGTKQLSLLSIDFRLIINMNNQLDTDFITKKQSNFRRSKHHQAITYSERYAYNLQTRLL